LVVPPLPLKLGPKPTKNQTRFQGVWFMFLNDFLTWQGRQFGNQTPKQELNFDVEDIRVLIDDNIIGDEEAE
jgi:hypothetical protein